MARLSASHGRRAFHGSLFQRAERESGVVHPLHEHEVVDAHGEGIGRRTCDR